MSIVMLIRSRCLQGILRWSYGRKECVHAQPCASSSWKFVEKVADVRIHTQTVVKHYYAGIY
jgi:hypothetical protein